MLSLNYQKLPQPFLPKREILMKSLQKLKMEFASIIMTWIFVNMRRFYYKSPHKNCNIETALIAAVSDLRILGPRYTGRIPERRDSLISSW